MCGTFICYRKDGKRIAEEWVKAPEFIPTVLPSIAGSSSSVHETHTGTSTSTPMPVSYAQAVNPTGQASNPALEPLCSFAEASGICKKLNCTYLHGDICELCNRAVLHPHNEELRKKHTNVSLGNLCNYFKSPIFHSLSIQVPIFFYFYLL